MNLKNYLLYIFLFATGFIYLAPLLLMFLYSLMPLTQIGRFPPDFIPDKFNCKNPPPKSYLITILNSIR